MLFYDVYRISRQANTPLIIEKKGLWTHSGGYQKFGNFKNTWVIRRRNFLNITLIGSTVVGCLPNTSPRSLTTYLQIPQLTEKPPGFGDMEYLADDKQLQQLDPMQRKTYQLFQLVERMFNLRWVRESRAEVCSN